MKELKKVLELHEKWLNGEQGGIRADLSNTDLRNVDLRGTNLNNADLSNAYLNNADLRFADLSNSNLSNAYLTSANLNDSNLSNANLRYTNLTSANLRCSDLRRADLRDADLRYTNLTGANLTGTDLRRVDLRYANLTGANLNTADLRCIKYNYLSMGLNLVCPEEGSYVGYKKAKNKDEEVIIKLLITEDALRNSATTRKCRCSKAEVLSITSLDNKKDYNEAYSNYDNSFIYRIGEIIEVKDFDTNRWNNCSTGIHHFITRKEAVEY